jgi:type IV pilus assembly protein PilX
MNARNSALITYQSQQGAVLVVALLFLVILTLLGTTAAQMSSLEERMSRNMRDRSIASQAAGLALRDAERDVLNSNATYNRSVDPTTSNFTPDCGGSTTSDTSDDGLCSGGVKGYASQAPNGTNYTLTTVAATTNQIDMTAAPSVGYGTYTGAVAIPNLSAQPRYILESFKKSVNAKTVYYYRITVRAQGVNPNTVVWLQEVFQPS